VSALVALARAIWGETLSLFVDDGRFAGAILVWLVLAGLVVWRLSPPPVLAAIGLFAGLAAILIASAVREARRRRRG
jgi:hypothetical protein